MKQIINDKENNLLFKYTKKPEIEIFYFFKVKYKFRYILEIIMISQKCDLLDNRSFKKNLNIISDKRGSYISLRKSLYRRWKSVNLNEH